MKKRIASVFNHTIALAALTFFTSPYASGQIRFEDKTQSTGLAHRHSVGDLSKQHLPQLMTAGLTTIDFDNDGRWDCYLPNGNALSPDQVGRNRLYQNQVGMRWNEVSKSALAETPDFALGMAAADFDNDGFQDIYLNNFGANRLLHNNGDGTFSDVTSIAQVGDGEKFGAGCAFLDIDNDGDLDIYSGNYVAFTTEDFQEISSRAYPFPPGPKDFPAVSDTLFRNMGDGTFADWSDVSGLAETALPSMGVTCGDFDMDGDSDVFVCCDGTADALYRNDGSGRLTEDAVLSGVAYDTSGIEAGSMGVDAADLNEDRISDLLVTNYQGQIPTLFESHVDWGFRDTTALRQAGRPMQPHVSWGLGWGDLDCDGDVDLIVANGHFLKNVDAIGTRTAFDVANAVMEQRQGRFADVSLSALADTGPPRSSRGIALEDFDIDGDLDVLIINCDSGVQYLSNTSEPAGKSLKVRLVGVSSNRNAIGAKVVLTTGNQEHFAEIRCGRGYQSHFGNTLHFGLGMKPGFGSGSQDSISIVWPGGKTETLSAEEILEAGLLKGHVITIIQSAIR